MKSATDTRPRVLVMAAVGILVLVIATPVLSPVKPLPALFLGVCGWLWLLHSLYCGVSRVENIHRHEHGDDKPASRHPTDDGDGIILRDSPTDD